MRGRGMSIVLVPDFSGKLGQSAVRNVAVILFQAVQPDDKIVTITFRQRHYILF